MYKRKIQEKYIICKRYDRVGLSISDTDEYLYSKEEAMEILENSSETLYAIPVIANDYEWED